MTIVIAFLSLIIGRNIQNDFRFCFFFVPLYLLVKLNGIQNIGKVYTGCHCNVTK